MNINFRHSILLLFTIPSLLIGANANVNEKIIYGGEVAIKEEWIVVLNQKNTWMRSGRRKLDVVAQKLDAVAQLIPGVEVLNTYTHAIEGFSAKMSRTVAQEMAQLKEVAYVEQNIKVEAAAQSDTQDNQSQVLQQSSSPLGGAGVTAYIFDTGIRVTHEEFEGRASFGINTSGDDLDEDCNGHGTHVAGIIGGATHGVAKQVDLVGVKVLTCAGKGSTIGVLDGVEWAMKDAKGKTATANMSLQSHAISLVLDTAVRNLQAQGIPTVVAAGNTEDNACNSSPAREPEAITVSAANGVKHRAYMANYGSCVDMFAPGSQVASAWTTHDQNYNTVDGTSMAAAHVCGGVALLLGSGISPNNVKEELEVRARTGKVMDAGPGSNNLLMNAKDLVPVRSFLLRGNTAKNSKMVPEDDDDGFFV